MNFGLTGLAAEAKFRQSLDRSGSSAYKVRDWRAPSIRASLAFDWLSGDGEIISPQFIWMNLGKSLGLGPSSDSAQNGELGSQAVHSKFQSKWTPVYLSTSALKTKKTTPMQVE